MIGEQLTRMIGRYKALANNGRIELSVTPYAHPIMPLLLDLERARRAMPDVVLPGLDSYPAERVTDMLDEASRRFNDFSVSPPKAAGLRRGASVPKP